MNLPYKVIENRAIWIMVAVTMLAVILMDRMGAQQKWHAAVFGTVGPIGVVAFVCHHKWAYWEFWASLGICFAVHVFAIWYVFERLFAPVKMMGILIWAPIAFAETIFILGLVPVLERKLRPKKRR
jgi:hypothetical protein